MSQYGFTAGELLAIDPSTTLLREKRMKHANNFGWNVTILTLIFLASFFVNFVVEPKIPQIGNYLGNLRAGVAHAEEKSDREQEIQYCKAWNKSQTKVSGATNMEIAEHCKNYLK